MTRLEAIKRLEWFLGVSKVVDSITLVGDDKKCLDMAIAALREKDVTDINVGNKTNADHIRSMTDDELAVFLECFGGCHYCPEYETAPWDEHGILDCDGDCEQHLLDWLKQPYKERI